MSPQGPGGNLETLEIARKAVEAASEKQASDIVLLDAREVCSFADYFIICSGDSGRQVKAIYEEIQQSLKSNGASLRHREGTLDSGWLLIDCGDLIVHIFAEEERKYYSLEEAWKSARSVVRIQ
jgi:ribosome-associated protein